ncbi:hypothetical protein PtA15_9A181 [Puccinia triticina]|uniref:Uncharacterized protein n=1 Tax=Puccinia triticina TaxID=208348 RepID=A0ABY7CS32_9BASI|nr:uncharacterized protein PtA15_9A181 [Puccinia triticina]WAQ88056.1 hypothetical protein PtA15_9A181 [Puccinia triticina]
MTNQPATQVVKQLVIRARPHHPTYPSEQSPAATTSGGLQVMMCIRLAIPYSSIPPLGSPDLIIPLMSDQRLRLAKHTIFPITRQSINSRPTIQASSHPSQAKLAASLLDLSKSFRTKPANENLLQPPPISVVVRNFSISLLIPPSPPSPISLDHPSPPIPTAEYAIVLDCLSLWATVGPEWPFSVILPTPPCLKNSFRLILPPESSDALFENSPKDALSPAVHLNTFPALRRERMRFSSSSRNILSAPKLSSIFHDDDLRPLSDESEPEGISLSDEEDKQTRDRHQNWPQDELSPRFEGVFQSTRELCILLGPYPSTTTTHTPLTAKHASSQLSVSIHHTPSTLDTSPDPTSMDISFHLDLQHVSTQSINEKTAFVLAIPDPVAKDIVSAQWSPLNGEGVIETQLPLPVQSITPILPFSSPPARSPQLAACSVSTGHHPSLAPCPGSDTSSLELDLLTTAAPFLDSTSEIPAEIIKDDFDLELDFDLSSSADEITCSPKKTNRALIQSSRSTTPHQFIAWIDTEWLIRRAATTHNSVRTRLVLNLRGQLEIRANSLISTLGEPCSKSFPIPFLILPSVEEHTCTCRISTDFPSSPNLQFTLPSWADLVEQSADDQSQQLRLSLPQDQSGLTEIIIARLDQPDSSPQLPETVSIIPESPSKQVPSSPLTRLTEPSLSINHLVINSGSRVKYHSRRSTISPLSLVKKRPRLYGSLRNKSNKPEPVLENETPQSTPFDEHPRAKPSIRSVQADLVIDRSSGKQSIISQYAEICITFCCSSDHVDSNLNILFPIGSDSRDAFEIVGLWIGEWKLIQDQGFQVSGPSDAVEDDRLEDYVQFVTIKVDVSSVQISRKGDTSSPLPTLRMIVLHKKIIPTAESEATREGSGTFICLLPSVETSVAAYKALLRASVGFQIQVKHSDMMVPENSPEKIQLVRYDLQATTSLVTSASIESYLPLLTGPKQVSNIPAIEPRESEDQADMLVEESEESHSGRSLARCTSWVEQSVLKWGLNWRTVLLCWLIYLVSSLSVQVEQMGRRLERMDNQVTAGGLPIELSQTLLEQTETESVLNDPDPAYPVEEEIDQSDKPGRPQLMDIRLKAALLRSILTPPDCARCGPAFSTESAPAGPAGPADPTTNPAEPPPPRSHTSSQTTQQHHDTHASGEMIRDFLGFFDRLFYLSVSQPLSKLAGSIGSFRQKLSFKQRPPPRPEF